MCASAGYPSDFVDSVAATLSMSAISQLAAHLRTFTTSWDISE